MNNAQHRVLAITALAALLIFAPTQAGEDLLLLSPGKPSASDAEKPNYSVNVVKLTLPPLTQPERGIHIEQTLPGTKPIVKKSLRPNAVFHSTLPKDAATRKALAPITALAAPENPAAALPPLGIITDIPGCVAPEDVAADKQFEPYATAASRGSRDNLLALPAMDAFPDLNLPVASPGISPALPAMPVYRDAAVETLEPFTPAPTQKKPPPEQLSLPLPLASECPVAPPGGLLPLTASVPSPGAYAPGAALLATPLGMSLTATMPSFSSGYYGPPLPGTGRGLTDSMPGQPPPRKKPPQKKAPSLAERNIPTIAADEEGGFTPVRGIKNLLGQ